MLLSKLYFYYLQIYFFLSRLYQSAIKMSGISVSLDNPYGDVTIPRAKLRGDQSLVIGNPVALGNPYAKTEGGEAQAPPPYNVKLAEPEEEMRCRACCYRCRRRKQ
jgi:hypothetical protein